MAYSDFKLSEIIEDFSLVISESSGLFANVVSIDLSEYYIKDIKKILGILYSAIAQNRVQA